MIKIDSKFHQTLTLESPNPSKDENEHRVLPGPSSRRRHRHHAGKRLLAGVREDGRATPPRGLGLQRAPPWLSSTVPRAALATHARRREGPWRRRHLHFLLSGRRERLLAARMREKGRERNELGFRGKAGRGGVFIRRNGRTAVGFDPTAWNDRATQRPRRGALPWHFAGPGPRCGLGRQCVRARERGRAE